MIVVFETLVVYGFALACGLVTGPILGDALRYPEIGPRIKPSIIALVCISTLYAVFAAGMLGFWETTAQPVLLSLLGITVANLLIGVAGGFVSAMVFWLYVAIRAALAYRHVPDFRIGES